MIKYYCSQKMHFFLVYLGNYNIKIIIIIRNIDKLRFLIRNIKLKRILWIKNIRVRIRK